MIFVVWDNGERRFCTLSLHIICENRASRYNIYIDELKFSRPGVYAYDEPYECDFYLKNRNK